MITREQSVDLNVFREVVIENCYRVPEKFPKDVVVVDVGSHIGTFALLCAQRGASKILSYEIEQENFEIAKENLADYPQVQLFNQAVWKENGKVSKSGMFMTADGLLKNTGSSHIVVPEGCHQGTIETITLDEIMRPYEKIAMVKIDAESAEFEIVPATKDWHKVERLVGEAHGYVKDYKRSDFYMEIKKWFSKLEVVSYCPEYGLDTFYASK